MEKYIKQILEFEVHLNRIWRFNHFQKRKKGLNKSLRKSQLRKSMNESIHALSVYGLSSYCSIEALTSCHMFWINCRRTIYISLEGRPHWTTARVQSSQGSREWAENHYAILKFKFPMKLWTISSTVLQSEIACWESEHWIMSFLS